MKNDNKGPDQTFEVDVAPGSASMDRLEISGMLAAVGADKKSMRSRRRSLGRGFGAGMHTVTLRFDAGHIKLHQARRRLLAAQPPCVLIGTDSLYPAGCRASGAV